VQHVVVQMCFCVVLCLLYLGVAFVNWVRDGLHKVVPHAAIWVSVTQVWVCVIAGLVAAGRLDQAQQGAAHQDQQEARGGTHKDRRFHDRGTLSLLILTQCPMPVAFFTPLYHRSVLFSVTIYYRTLHRRELLPLFCSC